MPPGVSTLPVYYSSLPSSIQTEYDEWIVVRIAGVLQYEVFEKSYFTICIIIQYAPTV